MNKAAQETQIVVDGKSYTLKFSLKAYVALQDHFKVASIDEVVQRLNDPTKLGMMDIVAMLWAGLRSHHKDATMEDALDMADSAGLQALQEIISAGVAGSMPPAGDGEAGADQTVRP